MSSEPARPTLRADAARNREVILAVAVRAFAEGAEPSLRALAREAGVGVGTLYRHFPTKEALVEAVYEDQLERLVEGARSLLAAHAPSEAMRRWMDLFAEWLASKHGMAGTLTAMVGEGQISIGQSRARLLAAVEEILAAGRSAGDIRPDARAEDVADSVLGILSVVAGPAGRGSSAADPQRVARVLDVLMDGLRARPVSGTEAQPR